MHTMHGQMRVVGVPQVVEPKISDARFSARRVEDALNVSYMSTIPVPSPQPGR